MVVLKPLLNPNQIPAKCQNNYKLTPGSNRFNTGTICTQRSLLSYHESSLSLPALPTPLLAHCSLASAPTPKMSCCAALQSIMRISPALAPFAISRNMLVTGSILPGPRLARASSSKICCRGVLALLFLPLCAGCVQVCI